jgi:hypothetical protein
MSDHSNPAKSTSTVNKPLWAAVAVLGEQLYFANPCAKLRPNSGP